MKKSHLLALLCISCLTIEGEGATFNVTSTSDSIANPGSLRFALSQSVQGTDPDVTINIQSGLGTITLTDHLPIVSADAANANITINGNNNTIDGDSSFQAFFVTPFHNEANSDLTATINDLTIQNCKAKGGNTPVANRSGGGGLGAGGAVFINKRAEVTVSNISFDTCNAEGGDVLGTTSGGSVTGGGGYLGDSGNGGGGVQGGSGGGGFRSKGGDPANPGAARAGAGGGGANIIPGLTNSNVTGTRLSSLGNGSGGGGILTPGLAGPANPFFLGGNGGNGLDGTGGGAGGIGEGVDGEDGTTSGGGGGGGARSDSGRAGAGGHGAFGGGGGGGGSRDEALSLAARGGDGGAFAGGGGGASGVVSAKGGFGGRGGDFGGGGGGTNSSNFDSFVKGGDGGFGGGGGANSFGLRGGNGGFGGGGGGCAFNRGYGGVGGGLGGSSGRGGGGGAGFGGAIFVREGGILNISDSSFSGNSVTAGVTLNTLGGATDGSAAGADIYMMTSSSVAFDSDIVLTGSLGLPPISSRLVENNTFVKRGKGNLIFTVASDYDAATTIREGTISISHDNQLGTDPSQRVTIEEGAKLYGYGASDFQINRSFVFDGTGAIGVAPGIEVTLTKYILGDCLKKVGPGTLTPLIAPITESVHLAEGKLDLSKISLNDVIVRNLSGSAELISGSKNLILTNTEDTSFAGSITGNGSIEKRGEATLEFLGLQSLFTGKFHVHEGSLHPNEHLQSHSVHVKEKGALHRGSVKHLQSAGTIKSGGLLSVGTSLYLEPSSIIEVALDPEGTEDAIQVAGHANLNGQVSVFAKEDAYEPGIVYPLLEAKRTFGEIQKVEEPTGTLQFSLVHTPQSVQISLDEISLFGNATLSKTAQSVADHLNEVANSYGLGAFPQLQKELFGLSFGSIDSLSEASLDQLHGAQYTAFGESQIDVATKVARLYHRDQSCYCNDFWISAYGNWIMAHGTSQQVGFSADSYGVALGLDRWVSDCSVLGIGAAYHSTFFSWRKNRGDARIHSVYGTLYGGYIGECGYFDATVLLGGDFFDTKRKVRLGDIHANNKADYSGFETVVQLGLGRHFGSAVTGFANLNYFYLDQFSFKEKKGDCNLSVKSYEAHTFRSELGLDVRPTAQCRRCCLSPYFSVAWIFQTPISHPKHRSGLIGQSTSFRVKGWDHTWNFFAPSVGFEYVDDCWSMSVNYQFEVGSGWLTHFANIGLERRF